MVLAFTVFVKSECLAKLSGVMKKRMWWFFGSVLLILISCQNSANVPTRVAEAALPAGRLSVGLPMTHTPLPPNTAVPTAPTITSTATFTPSPTITPTVTGIPPPTATPDLYKELTIDALRSRSYGGGQLQIVDIDEKTDTFTRYLITYPSDGLTIHGFMNVPNEGTKFPVALVLHGYINPDEYDTLAYTQRYADDLAEAGYFVIHPNLRNYPPSDSGPNPYRSGYAIDVLNLIAIIQEQSQDETGTLRRADADYIHLWGHSMGGGVVLRVLAVNNSPAIRAAVLYGSMSGDERRNYERIQFWSYGERGDFELAAPTAVLDLISPINYLDRSNVPIAIHHGLADDVVPVSWSRELCDLLEERAHPYECFFYEGQPHTFRGYGDELFMERVRLFFKSN